MFNPPRDDAHTVRDGKRLVQVNIAGADVTLAIPDGYRLIPVARFQEIETSIREQAQRSKDHYSTIIRQKDETILSQAEINQILQRRMDAAITRNREAQRDLRQAKACISFPFRWIFGTLLGRAVILEENERLRRMNELIEIEEAHTR